MSDTAAPKPTGNFKLSDIPLVGEPDPGEVHKYESAPVAVAAEPEPFVTQTDDLPASYGENRLWLVARDPGTLFAQWDFDEAAFFPAAHAEGAEQYFLRITTSSGSVESVLEVQPSARERHVTVRWPNTSYLAELGWFTRDGNWRGWVASGVAHTPPAAMAVEPPAPVEFATAPLGVSLDELKTLVAEEMRDGESLMAAVARVTGGARTSSEWTDEQRRLLVALVGAGVIECAGFGSAEFDEALRRALSERLSSEVGSGFAARLVERLGAEVSSPGGASWSGALGSWWGGISSGGLASWGAAPGAPARRGFFMHVNAEVIFYGGTDPGARVTVAGQPINLKSDGTFFFHFTLPDGTFEVPIVAESPDRKEQRSATLRFSRDTRREGDVQDTAQPEYLGEMIGRK